ncbi:MAG: LptF/LptG family permease [Planctomycetota bacterium]|jgi:lipopolysaccharide export LptBFGC system permease protein LptF|nr:LptF/LptG family permease [Planctomycetota bacterium]
MILTKAYLREILQRLFMVLAGVIFLVGLGAAIRASATSQGAPLWVPLSLVPLIVGQALPYFLPVVLLAGVVLTYGRMSSDLEHIAAFAAGKRPQRLLTAAMLAGALMSAISYPLAAEVVPSLYRNMRSLVNRVPVAALENTNPGSSELQYAGLYLSWRGRSGPGLFHNVLLSLNDVSGVGGSAKAYSDGDGEEQLRLRADSAHMTVTDNTLSFAFDGLRTFRDTRGLFTNPGRSWLTFNLSEMHQRQSDRLRAKDMQSSMLLQEIRNEEIDTDKRDHYRFIFWQRWSMSLSSIPLALVGALLGWRLRRGGFLAAFAATLGLLLFLYFPVFFLCDSLEEVGALPPLAAAWLPLFSLVPVGAFLMYKEQRA